MLESDERTPGVALCIFAKIPGNPCRIGAIIPVTLPTIVAVTRKARPGNLTGLSCLRRGRGRPPYAVQFYYTECTPKRLA
jgi:hypothetical protein